jgi:hypothetical protein
MKPILSALLVALAVFNSYAQSAKPSAQINAMSKLDWLIGNWKGAGWVEFVPGERRTFSQTERVEWKAGRTVVAVEGHGTTGYAGTNMPIHDAFAVISFDPRSRQYRWRSHTEKGHAADLEPTLGDRTFQWAMDVPEMGTMRYTIVLNDKGEWFETGEMSRDRKTWRKFFEMTLQKSAPAL